MSLKIRRGLEADRLTITPEEGEFVYTTDNKEVAIGDGTTVGGTLLGKKSDIALKENSANKSTSTGDSGSSVKFPVWSAIVSYFSASQIRTILGITTLSGSNTGDETTSSIQSKRPLKTVNGTSLEGVGDIPTATLPAGSNGEIQFNQSGAFGSSTNATIQGEELALPDIQNPSNPTNALKVYGKKIAERFFMTTKDPNGFENFIQPSLFTENIQLYKAAGSVNQMTVIGGPALTATGTATGSTIATTNIYTQSRILEYLQTTPGTTNVAGFRTSNAQFFRGASASQGGFFFVCRWAPSTGVATATNRACVGMHNVQTAPTDVEPSTILNQLSIGWDSADTNIQIMSNSGTGTATKKDLGASFPVPTADRTKVYEITFYALPGSSLIYYVAKDIGTGSTNSGTLDSAVDKVPSSTTLLGLRGYMSAGGTSSVIGIGLLSCYVSSNY